MEDGPSWFGYGGSPSRRGSHGLFVEACVAGRRTWCFFFSSRRRHTRFDCDWSSDVCSSDLDGAAVRPRPAGGDRGDRGGAAAPSRLVRGPGGAGGRQTVRTGAGIRAETAGEIGRGSGRGRV